jgi:pimeloyl-ACP methyl ester carboxylesterase
MPVAAANEIEINYTDPGGDGPACPTLIVHGTADAAIPVARAEAVRDGLGGPVTFIAVSGATHASNLTHPDEVNKAILGFLRGLDGG